MKPSQLSRELREEQTTELVARRQIIGLSMIGVAAGAIVGLYQTGIVKKLPDLPFKPFDSNKVDASDYAYKRFQTPDAFLMILQYGMTAWLAAAGGKNRAQTMPLLPLALAGKTILDAATTVELGREEWQENKALCVYCQIATVASWVSVFLALKEAGKAWKTLRA